MRPLAPVALVLCAALLWPRGAAAQQPIEFQTELSASEVVLGERFELRVLVSHPSDTLVNVEPPARSATLHLIEVRPRSSQPSGPGQLVTRFEYVLAGFALGDAQLPPLRLLWLQADGTTGETAVSPPPYTVRPLSSANDTSLRPLKPQLDVAGAPPAWQRPAATTTAALLLVALASLALRRARRPRVEVLVPMLDETGPEADARRRLDALAADDPLRHGDYDRYYGTIALVVRDYLEDRFGFGARALTTAELQRRMVGRGVERWQARLVAGLLDRCDGAVYARQHPDPASADHDLTVAFEIVELSRPRAEAVAQ